MREMGGLWRPALFFSFLSFSSPPPQPLLNIKASVFREEEAVGCLGVFQIQACHGWRAIGFNKHLLSVMLRISLTRIMTSSEALGDTPEKTRLTRGIFLNAPPPCLGPFVHQVGLLCRLWSYLQLDWILWESEHLGGAPFPHPAAPPANPRPDHPDSWGQNGQHALLWLLENVSTEVQAACGKCWFPSTFFSQCCFNKDEGSKALFWDNMCRLLLDVESEPWGLQASVGC